MLATLPLRGSLAALQDEAAERAAELEKLLENPAALFGVAGGAAILGLFLITLRQAIVRAAAPSAPRPSFRWTDLLAVIAGLLLSQVVAVQVVVSPRQLARGAGVLDEVVEALPRAGRGDERLVPRGAAHRPHARRRADGLASLG